MTVGTDVINFDQALDMEDSTAFSQGYIDWMNRYIYLVFDNGTLVTRMLDADFTPEDAKNVDSWGSFWWSEVKDWWLGPTIDSNPTFRQRPAAPTNWNLGTTWPQTTKEVHVEEPDDSLIGVPEIPEDDEGIKEDMGVSPNVVSLSLHINNPDEAALIMTVLLETGDFIGQNFDVSGANVSSWREFN